MVQTNDRRFIYKKSLLEYLFYFAWKIFKWFLYTFIWKQKCFVRLMRMSIKTWIWTLLQLYLFVDIRNSERKIEINKNFRFQALDTPSCLSQNIFFYYFHVLLD